MIEEHMAHHYMRACSNIAVCIIACATWPPPYYHNTAGNSAMVVATAVKRHCLHTTV
jgi:hypothetical protein